MCYVMQHRKVFKQLCVYERKCVVFSSCGTMDNNNYRWHAIVLAQLQQFSFYVACAHARRVYASTCLHAEFILKYARDVSG